ncbi:hypothetical protein DAI22_12g072850 [Oryza sativa Japonica Group]|nr:hypothetical protein DAI22_12g072850 [Oryza sativa Japonica Group]
MPSQDPTPPLGSVVVVAQSHRRHARICCSRHHAEASTSVASGFTTVVVTQRSCAVLARSRRIVVVVVRKPPPLSRLDPSSSVSFEGGGEAAESAGRRDATRSARPIAAVGGSKCVGAKGSRIRTIRGRCRLLSNASHCRSRRCGR